MTKCKICELELPPEMFKIEKDTCANCLALFFMQSYQELLAEIEANDPVHDGESQHVNT